MSCDNHDYLCLHKPKKYYRLDEHHKEHKGIILMNAPDLDPKLAKIVLERLITHFRDNPEIQNIDIMNTAGFCRNCLSKWYREASEENAQTLSDKEARQLIYGMDYQEWKEKHQTPTQI